MKITITGRHLEITDALRNYITERLNKAKFYHLVKEVSVVLTVEKFRNLAEITVKGDGFTLTSQEETHDMTSSIETVIEKLERQLARQKDLYRTKKRQRRIKAEPAAEIIEDKHLTPPTRQIIKSDKFYPKPISVDEAALQMELTKDNFIVFLNSATNKVNVIYLRKDGNLGLIEPEY